MRATSPPQRLDQLIELVRDLLHLRLRRRIAHRHPQRVRHVRWHLPLPRRQILSQRPLLPQPYTCSERTLTLYTSELKAASGQSFFWSVQLGIQIHCTCRLWLVHDTRRGEKAHDQQRRLERYREQRPGGL